MTTETALSAEPMPPRRSPAALLGLASAAAVALPAVVWATVGREAGWGVAAGFLAAGLPSLFPITAALRGRSVVLPAMAAMGLRMVAALALAGGVLVTQGKGVLQPFAAGMCVAYVLTLFAETSLLAKLLGDDSQAGSPFQFLSPETER